MSRRARVRMTLTAAAGAVVLAIAVPTSASAAPVAGCPAPWSETSAELENGQVVDGGLWTIREAERLIAAEGFDLDPADSNEDSYLCIKFVKGNPNFDPAFVFRDNTVGGTS
jgi:hypothetical protein